MAKIDIEVKLRRTIWYYVAKVLVFTGAIKIKKVYYWICGRPLIIMDCGKMKHWIFFND